MRILLSAYSCEPNCGSERGNGWNWALHLAELGHEIWVLTLVNGQEAIERALASEPMPNAHFIYVDAPAWVKRHIKGQIGFFSHYIGWQQQAYNRALRLDQEYDFELVHHVTLGSLTAGSWLWRLNKPFIFGPVGGGQVAPPAFKKYFVDRWRGESIRSFINQRLIGLNPITRQTVSRADLVLVTNRETSELAHRLGASRVEFLLDTALPQDYFPQKPPDRPISPALRLLWVAGLHARKGLPLALESLSKVNPLLPFKMTVLGGGPLSHYVPNWIKEFGLEDQVEYRGQVSWREVKHEYLNSDAFLFTSLRDSSGAQLLEAMAHALPVIILNHQGARDFVPDGAGIKVPVTNPTETVNALAQAIEYLFKNPKERSEMGRIGYDFAKMQTWKHKALKMSEYYKEIKLR